MFAKSLLSSGEIWNLACKFAVGVCSAYVSDRVGGGILCIFLLLGAIFLFYRDVFSVAKLKRLFGCCGCLLCSVYALFNLS
jgi:hypothetical protein